MNVHIIIIILVHHTSALPPLNLGTVLFTPEDVNKRDWTRNELSLLQARKDFQNILPPPQGAFTDDYIKSIFKYFEDAYSAISKQSTDPIMIRVLTTALSDVIGGYLKFWVIPVTNSAYYSGSVPYDSAAKVHKFYENIKQYLRTNGSDWSSPDDNLLKNVPINIVARQINERETKSGCNDLAFYEKTSNGLLAPLPRIKWDANTMFLPFKNQFLFSLDSPESAFMLFKYYDLVIDCLQNNPEMLEHFKRNFQTWLGSSLCPHLAADVFYPGLYGVLSLSDVHRLRYSNNDTKLYSYKIPWNVKTKKFWIIATLIFLEVMWCFIAALFLFCKKRRGKCNNDLESNNGDFDKRSKNKYSCHVSKIITPKTMKSSRSGFMKLFKHNVEVETLFRSTDSRDYKSSVGIETLPTIVSAMSSVAVIPSTTDEQTSTQEIVHKASMKNRLVPAPIQVIPNVRDTETKRSKHKKSKVFTNTSRSKNIVQTIKSTTKFTPHDSLHLDNLHHSSSVRSNKEVIKPIKSEKTIKERKSRRKINQCSVLEVQQSQIVENKSELPLKVCHYSPTRLSTYMSPTYAESQFFTSEEITLSQDKISKTQASADIECIEAKTLTKTICPFSTGTVPSAGTPVLTSEETTCRETKQTSQINIPVYIPSNAKMAILKSEGKISNELMKETKKIHHKAHHLRSPTPALINPSKTTATASLLSPKQIKDKKKTEHSKRPAHSKKYVVQMTDDLTENKLLTKTLTPSKPYFEIKMDTPRAEITLGIDSGVRKRHKRVSRIPRRCANWAGEEVTVKPVSKEEPLNPKFKSQIPKFKRTVDDSAISTHKGTGTEKLNVTF